MTSATPRRAVAEFVGTTLLMLAIVGSGITMGDDGASGLFHHAAVVGATLVALIVTLAPVSGAHFNPAVTLAFAADGDLDRREVLPFVVAQIAGAVVGAVLANAIFGEPLVATAANDRGGIPRMVSEGLATGGLVLVIFGSVRARREAHVPYVVGAWIMGAIVFTSSASFANPAVTIGRAFTATWTGIQAAHVPGFLIGQAVGTVGAVLLGRWLFTPPHDRAGLDRAVPLFAERLARERLRSPATMEDHVTTDTPTILFLCVHNAGRSQMAAGWTTALGGDGVEVLSGGSEPASEVNPTAIEAMAEVGIDIRASSPKPWTDQTLGAADVIVTMGCGDTCPVVPGKRYLDWELTDPAGKDLASVRPIRDDIEQRVRSLLAELDVPVRA